MDSKSVMIRIGIDPNLALLGPLTLSWHGFFTFVAVALAVYLGARWAREDGMLRALYLGPVESLERSIKGMMEQSKVDGAEAERRVAQDILYSVAVWAIIGGVVGARLVHVIDRWDFYGPNPFQIIAIWNGGIAIYGAIIGGLAGGALYAYLKGYSVGALADLAAPAVLLAMAAGRIGDIINGEHISSYTGMPWGFIYTHPGSPSYGLAAQHPAVVYEMIWDMLCFGVVWSMRKRLAPPGMVWVLFLSLYSFGRFFISFYREDKLWLAGLTQAHLIAIIFVAFSVPFLMLKAKLVSPSLATGSKAAGRGKRSSKKA
ncbi:MAG: prolipoprotein diacylglyceryl transferase [Chloroflexi bacterium]|nr:prolipoprotein diacylglyceryl transferase [Chloroflexota bacterium]